MSVFATPFGFFFYRSGDPNSQLLAVCVCIFVQPLAAIAGRGSCVCKFMCKVHLISILF